MTRRERSQRKWIRKYANKPDIGFGEIVTGNTSAYYNRRKRGFGTHGFMRFIETHEAGGANLRNLRIVKLQPSLQHPMEPPH